MIRYLEDQRKEQEAIDAAAEEYMYQNTPIGRGVKGKATEQLNCGEYIKKAREKAEQAKRSECTHHYQSTLSENNCK